jgi:hypothetical protein
MAAITTTVAREFMSYQLRSLINEDDDLRTEVQLIVQGLSPNLLVSV